MAKYLVIVESPAKVNTIKKFLGLDSPLDYKEIQLVHPKGNHSWVFIGRTDVEAETPIFCLPDVMI